MTDDFKCLAVRQPWAWAICVGAKDIENRTWTTTHRGTIAIVASGKQTAVNGFVRAAKPRKLGTSMLTYSAVIGFVDVIDVVPLSADLEKNPWAFGPYCWRLANARLLRSPIPTKARLNVYKADPELAARIREAATREPSSRLDDESLLWIDLAKLLDEPRLRSHLESYEQLEDHANVERLASRGLEKEPEDPEFLYDLGISLSEQQRPAEALEVLNRYIAVSPDNPYGYFHRGIALLNLGEEERANADFDRTKEIDPEFDVTLEDVEPDEKSEEA